MGNAATCSLVDIAGTVTVTQTNGQVLEFMQPIFASEVRKQHPGNWLVHYVSVHDSKSGKQHGKMSMLQGGEELETGQIYFLLPIPSHFRKRVLGPHMSRRSNSTSTSTGISTSINSSNCATSAKTSSSSCVGVSTAVSSPQPLQTGVKAMASSSSPSRNAGSAGSTASSSTPVYQVSDHERDHEVKSIQQSVKTEWLKSKSLRLQGQSPVFSMSGSSVPLTHNTWVQQPRASKKSKCSNRQKIQLLDWRPTLMTIQEAF